MGGSKDAETLFTRTVGAQSIYTAACGVRVCLGLSETRGYRVALFVPSTLPVGILLVIPFY